MKTPWASHGFLSSPSFSLVFGYALRAVLSYEPSKGPPLLRGIMLRDNGFIRNARKLQTVFS